METMQFMRGDGADHTFAIPADAWSSGGRLFFAAKPVIDDDTTDANAVIQGNWGDDVVTDVTLTIEGVATPCKRYACHFSGSATASILSDGAESADYLGEFQWVPAGGADPVTVPGPGEERIPVNLSFDVKRKTVV